MSTPETQCRTTHHTGCACHEKGWQNKWQCAVEMAAQAESKLDALVEHHTRMIIAHAKEVHEWREKAEHLAIACKVWEDEATLHPFMHCPDCKELRGHGHQCKSEPLQPPTRNCRECCGQGQVEIQSGPYMTECPECDGTGKQNNQPKP